MPEKTEDKKITLIESIKNKTRFLHWVALLITCTILFVNVRVISTVLNYIPSISVVVMLSFATGLVLIGFYIARKISLAEEKIHSLAYYDNLTGLPNRTFCLELITQAIRLAYRHKRNFATLFIDLDFFKRINDTLGHAIGDQLLQAVSERLQKYIRKSDHIARLEEDDMAESVSRIGGDEYIVLLNEIKDPHDAAKVANRILTDLLKPFKLNNHEVYVTASIGISVFPFDGEDSESLLRNADIAMSHAKKQGRNNFQFYSESMNTNALKRLTLENNLRKALERKEVFLHYQPKMDAKDKKIVGVEALIRWKHPELGLVSPAEFIPLAEETGLIIPIGEWVLRTACSQNKAWQKAGLEPIRISVNLSSRQFEQKNLLETISLVLFEADLDPEYLELEITESTVMKNPKYAIATLQELKATGINISIDDFGTGYSSLNYLRQLPLDSLKVDRSFVNKALTSTSDASIISAIIALAHNLNLKVVAEGVETEEQLKFLRKLQCNEVQGYLFSKPLHADEFVQLLNKLSKYNMINSTIHIN
jgi:diguanylate cyclase (GGDEF)-like protein